MRGRCVARSQPERFSYHPAAKRPPRASGCHPWALPAGQTLQSLRSLSVARGVIRMALMMRPTRLESSVARVVLETSNAAYRFAALAALPLPMARPTPVALPSAMDLVLLLASATLEPAAPAPAGAAAWRLQRA